MPIILWSTSYTSGGLTLGHCLKVLLNMLTKFLRIYMKLLNQKFLCHCSHRLFKISSIIPKFFWSKCISSAISDNTRWAWTPLVATATLLHCVKSVQIRSFFWSVFACIRTEYGEIRSISPYSVRMRENTDQKKLRTWTLFTQCFSNWGWFWMFFYKGTNHFFV